MQKGNSSINLVKNKVSILDQFIKWALTIGRGLVIAVEIVALSTFLYRFVLDRQIIDTREKIQQQQAIVEYLKVREEEYRNVQERILLTKDVSPQAPEKTKILGDITSFTPPDMTINSFSISEDSLRITVDVLSISSLTQFVNSLKTYKIIETISVDRIENKSSLSAISVNITCFLRQEKKESK